MWHCEAFHALTGVELSTPDHANFLCLNCAEILKIFNKLGKTAANLQKSYSNLMQDLADDIKIERENENNEISFQMLDGSNVVISDDETFCEESKECTVRLTRLDPETVDQYEYCLTVESTEEHSTSQSSLATAKINKASTKKREPKKSFTSKTMKYNKVLFNV